MHFAYEFQHKGLEQNISKLNPKLHKQLKKNNQYVTVM